MLILLTFAFYSFIFLHVYIHLIGVINVLNIMLYIRSSMLNKIQLLSQHLQSNRDKLSFIHLMIIFYSLNIYLVLTVC